MSSVSSNQSRIKGNFTEALYAIQNKKVESEIENKFRNISTIKRGQYEKDVKKTIQLYSQNNEWEYSLFDSDLIFKEDTPLISNII
jgi:hypothetical protein